MAAFDAEIYLRLLGERVLGDPDQHHHHRRTPLDGPAGALVAARALTAERAARVIADYAAAGSIRGDRRGFAHLGRPTRRRGAGHLAPRRTMALGCELAFAGGRLLLRDLAIRGDGGTLRYRWRRDAPGGSHGGRMFGGAGGFPWGRAPLVIVDPAGNRPTVVAGGGGGSDEQWDGKLMLQGQVSPDAAWLEVDGHRIDLGRRTAHWDARIEPLEAEDPIERFLWRSLAVGEMPFGEATELEPALDALLAAGALLPDSTLLKDVRAVAARLPGRRRHPQPSGGGSLRGLPEPWRSLLRRLGREDGPERTFLLGALAPPCDGFQFAAHSLTSDSAGFEIEFELAPNALWADAVQELPVAWWARDDRGNHYLGGPNGWSGSDEGAEGTMRYWPALDPRARRIDLLMCVDAHQAVVSVALEPDAAAGP